MKITDAYGGTYVDDRAQVRRAGDGSYLVTIGGQSWPVRAEPCFVAMFDLLGFGSLAKRLNLIDTIVHVESSVQTILRMANWDVGEEGRGSHPKQGPFCETLRFSDTVLLYQTKVSAESFQDWVTACVNFTAMSIAAGIPVRGALTAGELFVDPTKRVYLGKGIVSAYELERAQDWAGAVLDVPSVSVLGISDGDMEPLFKDLQVVNYDCPFKKGYAKAVVLGWPKVISAVSEDMKSKLLELNPTPEKGAQSKIDNTLEFFNYFKKTFPPRHGPQNDQFSISGFYPVQPVLA